MPERLLHSLGEHFVYHKIREKYGMTFERFVHLWQQDLLSEYIN